jgi:putative hemolysin
MILNGFLVLSEFAIVTARKPRLAKKANEGNKAAKVALKLANHPQRTLSALQFFITLVGFMAAAYGGVELTEPIAKFYRNIPLTAKYADNLGFITIVALTTYLSLVLGELVPKTIALQIPEKVSLVVAPVMLVLNWIATPVVGLLQLSTKLFLSLLFLKNVKEPPITEEELQLMIEQGSEHGVIDENESQMMKGVFRIGDRKVSSLMTHRNEIVWIDIKWSEEEVYSIMRSSIHSSFPVCDADLDKILGVVFIKDIAVQIADQKKINIGAILKKPLFVPETMAALELLELFKTTRNHTGFITDEFGILQGVVTFHDILEAIVGELPLSDHETEAELTYRNDGSILVDGSKQIDEVLEEINIKDFKESDLGNYKTLGGFIMHRLGRIPKASDYFEFKGYIFEVMDMDGKRVDKVLIRKSDTDN